jgi:hypothetical protein
MVRRSLAVATIFLSACASSVVGCGAGEPQEDDEVADGTSALGSEWTPVGNGVAYRRAGSGSGVFIAYGGYSARHEYACAWANALQEARLQELGVGHVYCVKGPRDAGYGAREIGNSKLAMHLEQSAHGTSAPFILIAAHSSGHYVAAELLNQVAADTLDRIVYADLDGGYSGLTTALVRSMKHVAFVWAEDSTLAAGRSSNAAVMKDAAARFGAQEVRVREDGSGCLSGAKWCLHDVVITTRPHDPARYDLARDYVEFTDRAVQTQWVDAIAPKLL